MNFNLNNSKIITIFVIVLLILFAVAYVYVNRDGFENEGFANFPIAVGDIVQLQGGLNNVQIGSENTPLQTSIINMIQQELNNVIPALTIVPFYGTRAPAGWQLCDGKSLNDINGNLVKGSDGNIFYTPNLQGRVIVGTTTGSNLQPPLKDQNGTNLDTYSLGKYSGEEKHILLINEIPSHAHISGSYTNYDWGGNTGGLRFNDNWFKMGDFQGGKAGGNSQGNTDPHNNMQPYYTLTYIIKQPLANANLSSV